MSSSPLSSPVVRRFLRAWTGLLLLVGLATTVGCKIIPDPAPDPTRFFVLTGPGLTAGVSTPSGTLRIGLRSVELAPYLQSRSLIVRNGSNEIAFEDYSRWAEPLNEGIARVLRARLTVTPEVERVYSHPFPFNRERDYDISVNVIRCEGARDSGGAVARFAAVFEISAASDGRVITRKTVMNPDIPWDGQDYPALVAAWSEAVSGLADAIISSLPSVPPSK